MNEYSMQPPLPDLTSQETRPTAEERAARREERRRMLKSADAWARRLLRSWWFWVVALPLLFATVCVVLFALLPGTSWNYWLRDWLLFAWLSLRSWFR